jgi:hypothetical protein
MRSRRLPSFLTSRHARRRAKTPTSTAVRPSSCETAASANGIPPALGTLRASRNAQRESTETEDQHRPVNFRRFSVQRIVSNSPLVILGDRIEGCVKARLHPHHRRNDRVLRERCQPQHECDACRTDNRPARTDDGRGNQRNHKRKGAARVTQQAQVDQRAADDGCEGVEIAAQMQECNGREDERKADERTDPCSKRPHLQNFDQSTSDQWRAAGMPFDLFLACVPRPSCLVFWKVRKRVVCVSARHSVRPLAGDVP